MSKIAKTTAMPNPIAIAKIGIDDPFLVFDGPNIVGDDGVCCGVSIFLSDGGDVHVSRGGPHSSLFPIQKSKHFVYVKTYEVSYI